MHSNFHAKNKTRYNRQIVNKKRDEWELIRGEGRRWTGVRLTIPPYIPESRLDCCDIIDIKYELNFRIDISGKNNHLSCSIPLIVGSVTNSNDRPEMTYTLKKMGNWRSKDDLYSNAATLPIRHTGDRGLGGESDQSQVRSPDDVDPEMYSESTLRFRRPIDIGETRHNPLMDMVGDDAGLENYMPDSGGATTNGLDSDDGQYNRLSGYDHQENGGHYQNGGVQHQDEFHIEPDMTEGMSDEEDGDFPPPPTPSTLKQPPTPTMVPPTPTGLPPPPPISPPPPPPLRPGP